MNIGATRTCIGWQQAKAYAREHKERLRLTKSEYAFRFGDGLYMSQGVLSVCLPTLDGSFILVRADVVHADVPLLIGLDFLDEEKLVANNVDNVLESRKHGWKMPLTRRGGHLFLKWDTSPTLHTRRELKKLHHQFWNPSAGKLYNLLKRAKSEDTSAETQEVIEQISSACDTCAKYGKGPHRFRVSLPEGGCVFNRTLALDLMWLKGKPALHVVDDMSIDIDNHFSAAIFLPSKSTKDIWHCFIVCWAATYVGYPDKFRVEQESVFTGKEFNELSKAAGIEVQLSGVESHNAIGVGERYHDPLRRIFLRIFEDVPDIDQNIALQLAVKAMNDTVGPEGLVPSLLVFGTLPRFTPHTTPLISHSDRMEAMDIARLEMADIVV